MTKDLLLYFALLLWFVVPSQAQPTIFAPHMEAEIGEVIEVGVYIKDVDTLSSMQFAMDWDDSVIEYQEVKDFALPLHSAASFFLSTTGKLRTIWVDQITPTASGIEIDNNEPLYKLVFKVIGDPADITDISFGEDAVDMEPTFFVDATGASGTTLDIEFDFGSVTIPSTNSNKNILSDNAPFNISQNKPNPFTEFTQIPFYSSKSQNITITVTDIIGQEVLQYTNYYPSGDHFYLIEKDNFHSDGTYFYTVSSDIFSITKKMIFKNNN